MTRVSLSRDWMPITRASRGTEAHTIWLSRRFTYAAFDERITPPVVLHRAFGVARGDRVAVLR